MQIQIQRQKQYKHNPPLRLRLRPPPRGNPEHQAKAPKTPKAAKPAAALSRPNPSPDDLIAAGLDAATAVDFIAHKKAVKAPLTARAWADHLAESAKAGWTPQDAAAKVIARSWKGFEAKYVADLPGSSLALNGGPQAGLGDGFMGWRDRRDKRRLETAGYLTGAMRLPERPPEPCPFTAAQNAINDENQRLMLEGGGHE